MWAKIRAERVSPRVCCPARAAGELDFLLGCMQIYWLHVIQVDLLLRLP